MAQIDKPSHVTQIAAEVASINTAINTYITTNGNNQITGAILNSVLQQIKTSLNLLQTTVVDSYHNTLSMTTDDVTQGANPDRRYLSDANFAAVLSNAAVVTTDDLNEGATNLYYTDARADARINTLRPTQGAVTPPAGGATVDAEARTAISSIISALQSANILT